MKKVRFEWLVVSAVVWALGGFAQTDQPASGSAAQATTQATSQAAASAADRAAVAANTEIAAALESTVDARKATAGDEVAARVTKDVKQDGRVVVRKGDRLLGKVVSAEANGTGNAGSRLALQFDRLQSGKTTSRLHTVVTAVLATQADATSEPEPMMGSGRPPMPAPQPRPGGSAGGGGLLGGVGSTVGGTLGTVDSVAGSAGGALGSTTEATLGTATTIASSTPARVIRVESQGSANQATGLNSMFSIPQGNLRLESGTTLQFRVVGQTEKPVN